jgi:arginine utilization protein RocB
MDKSARARHWALALTAVPSVSGTEDEAAFADLLIAMLAPIGAEVWTIPVAEGRFPRACVCALVRGSGARTVVLTGHYDTVGADYGALEPLACRPEALRAALLARQAASEAERRALADLAGPDFLPGRGLLDMKSGLAAALVVLEDFAARPQRQGNLLFLAVPDEEVNSAGARAAAAALPAEAARRGLSLQAAINLDAMVDDGDGSLGRAVAMGSVGKLLPSALVVGRPTHAAAALDGVSAGALAGALAAAVEWAPELVERTGDEQGAAPTLLGLGDGKSGYDVTMPASVWMFWNVVAHRRGPGEVLDALALLARRALAEVGAALAGRARQLGRQTPLPQVPVLTYAALRQEVAGLDGVARAVAAEGLDLPEQCRRITEFAWAASGRSGPAVVLGFASVPYLPVTLGGDVASLRLAAAVERARAEMAARHGVGVRTLRYFPGISDMSFFGQADAATVQLVAANTPAWGAGLPWPEGGAIGGIPTVNAGPWGRDYHTRLERLHAAYAFDVLPDLVEAIARGVLAA